jgi:hypothetical protein
VANDVDPNMQVWEPALAAKPVTETNSNQVKDAPDYSDQARTIAAALWRGADTTPVHLDGILTELAIWVGYGATSSASLAAMSGIDPSDVLRPLREPRRGLTSRRASYVVPCTMGTS